MKVYEEEVLCDRVTEYDILTKDAIYFNKSDFKEIEWKELNEFLSGFEKNEVNTFSTERIGFHFQIVDEPNATYYLQMIELQCKIMNYKFEIKAAYYYPKSRERNNLDCYFEYEEDAIEFYKHYRI